MPNRLINETSPYLLQHAENPVDWFPWGPEALELAKTKDKPILLSVGYSACHWCHVMERESFENYDIATLMNENFINIKVDREERPDVDSIYMTAIQAMTGSGGWPMTVFLTPEGKPFYGGTYFPPEDRRGMPGLPKILTAISAAYQQNRSEVANTTKQLMDQCIQFSTSVPSREPLNENIMDVSYTNLYKQFDTTYGGIGMQPKFPQPMTYEFLLRHYVQTGDQKSLNMVELTLEKMANGGIYDQLGGGFHRYSTDIYWLVPHFEKMLYDNALLVRLYLHAYQITRKEKYKTVVEETLNYVTREMTDSNGGFHSAQDADSDGVEGQFFVWRPDEIIKILGKSKGELINEYYSITDIGNFEGKNILTTKTDLETFAKKSLKNKHELIQLIEFSKSKLLDSRNLRVKPLRDEKIIAAWNGLMLAAFAEAGSVLKNPTYITIAETNASFLLDNLCVNGRILRSFKDGKAHLNGYLEDYAFLISGLILLHEATSNDRWILEAIRLGDSMLDLFWDEKTGQLYDTGKDHDKLIFRPRDISDNAIPSGNSMATDVLLKLALITGNSALKTVATTTLKCSIDLMSRFPSGAGHWLCTLDFYLSATKEIVIRGKRGDANTESLYDEVYRNFIPNRIVLGTENPDAELSALPLIQQSTGSNVQPVAYVCQNYTCKFPSHHPDTMREQLGQSM